MLAKISQKEENSFNFDVFFKKMTNIPKKSINFTPDLCRYKISLDC